MRLIKNKKCLVEGSAPHERKRGDFDLSAFLFGNLSMMLYSLAGGLFSLLVMVLLKKKEWLSIAGVSIAGGVSHNIGQLAVAVLVVQNLKIAFYLPALLIAGLVTGGLIGMLVYKIKPLIQ